MVLLVTVQNIQVLNIQISKVPLPNAHPRLYPSVLGANLLCIMVGYSIDKITTTIINLIGRLIWNDECLRFGRL
jgi:hypothetical protein